MNTVLLKTFSPPPIDRKEIFRYVGVKSETDEMSNLLDNVLLSVEDKLTYNVCFAEISKTDGALSVEYLSKQSNDLKKYFENCEYGIVFAATVGVQIDREIERYSKTEPSKAVMIDALGTERVESLCDAFCAELLSSLSTKNLYIKPRVSAGYGDIPLELQKDIFALLDTPKKIGVSLSDSLLMIPSKSVTGFISIEKNKCEDKEKCKNCSNTDCLFRR